MVDEVGWDWGGVGGGGVTVVGGVDWNCVVDGVVGGGVDWNCVVGPIEILHTGPNPITTTTQPIIIIIIKECNRFRQWDYTIDEGMVVVMNIDQLVNSHHMDIGPKRLNWSILITPIISKLF